MGLTGEWVGEIVAPWRFGSAEPLLERPIPAVALAELVSGFSYLCATCTVRMEEIEVGCPCKWEQLGPVRESAGPRRGWGSGYSYGRPTTGRPALPVAAQTGGSSAAPAARPAAPVTGGGGPSGSPRGPLTGGRGLA